MKLGNSRTYTTALAGLGAELLLAAIYGVIVVVLGDAVDPAVLEHVSNTIQELAESTGILGAGGAAALGFRDGMSRGATTSDAKDAKAGASS